MKDDIVNFLLRVSRWRKILKILFIHFVFVIFLVNFLLVMTVKPLEFKSQKLLKIFFRKVIEWTASGCSNL
jgi:hypothetical protein